MINNLIMLPKLFDKIKSYQYHVFLGACIILISFTSYNLGKINALQKLPIKIQLEGRENNQGNNLGADIYSAIKPATSNQLPAAKLDTRVVVSKASNSKKYHYTWCPGALKIKESNKLWFNSSQEAEIAGYTLAGNCEK